MFLKRVKIPHFRVLENVDLHFDPSFIPTIFPVGSLNGGGKSTLLQLVFILLHCSFEKSRHQYLSNLLSKIANNNHSEMPTSIAYFELVEGEKEFSLEFILYPSTFNDLDFNCFLEIENIKKEISQKQTLKRKIARIDSLIRSFEDQLNSSSRVPLNGHRQFQKIMRIYEETCGRYSKEIDFIKLANIKFANLPENHDVKETLDFYKKSIKYMLSGLEEIEIEWNNLEEMRSSISSNIEELTASLLSENLLYISHITDNITEDNTNDIIDKDVLLCRTTESLDFLKEISSKVYLATPISQTLLFLSEESRRKVLSTDRHVVNSYFNDVKIAQNNLPGLFGYNFESASVISNAFKKARDKDFEEALIMGEYGENLKKLKQELHDFFFGKTITIAPDFSRVIFKLENSDEELYAEDLSHGELRKLSIYLWLRSNEIKDSVILMDEIEIGMHPDWQYEIVNDLQTWSNNNQFILATHSYELCQAVTPAHVNELNPKLIKQ
ncbi:AAA family ATPase [Spirulina sp. CCNP1310]|uniref:AAA family ATPase n=1 Tax=Spirulina sp. CCNP1310 TaxID=3110249 RepID=UPI002B1FF140|nr:AAA family ATPase [Spirulina sp. CCNP1310]MEA5420298.1 AAA family ATPase [Spirulina sp. CCNP1310]